ncbi:AdoMet dependent proline di-methyltransferase-domain-containing protein [Kockovaella imperatae]|uniref:Alpha N-terminal protein methyltransferase 1 n=1 Tax=Kockovaella imperatae TaxID=4999 RepID=A0A1Y1UIZ6_9TREE|nr:AdoMet dependent proline di-methyltransferase-domain-containing protein [Kockovaella imperatae]ORX37456.1 AdoMet dependent proline di-methyltransferase-domain-containing protein [Kockovaella imperatae]
MSTLSSSPPAKRARPNVGSALKKQPVAPPPAVPDFDKGIQYWDEVEASVNGVLGGFGEGPVPHIEQLSSRLLLLSLLPSLHTFPSPLTPFPPPRPKHRLTVLDVGAGIGRVTANTLLPLFEDVVLVEPVQKFIQEGYANARAGKWRDIPAAVTSDNDMSGKGKGNQDLDEGWRGKRVWFLRGGLQTLDPLRPQVGADSLGVLGRSEGGESSEGFGRPEGEVVYDVVWCQWCLGHLSSPELVAFLKRARASLRPDTRTTSDGSYETMLFVKENVCEDGPGGQATEFLDEQDSSLTRSNAKWLEVFREAGLEVIREEVQIGMPSELFVVKTWALR